MKKVLLLSMPFGALERPALGLSLLKSRLIETGIACDVRYLNFALADFIGREDYHWVNYELPYTAFAGDWLFTSALYGERPENDAAYIDEILRRTWMVTDTDIARLLRMRAYVPHFLRHCVESIKWDEYALVGFTSTFEQNIASLSLARMIKEFHTQITIVFGGANWESEMGCELHRQFRFVDYVCSGEAENSFTHLARVVLTGGKVGDTIETIRGIVYRKDAETIFTGQAELIRDMDDLPIPDFSDYFRDLGECAAASSIPPMLLFESSRGCWWGARSHCTFCGLNGGTMAFRSKSAGRALAEIEYLVDRWQTNYVEAVDNILDMKYFGDFLPALARRGRSLTIFYEVKANLNEKQVRMLRDAGVYRIQPGIESLSDHILKLMRKGTTALRNIQLLKWGRQYGVVVEWNILYGFPGETREDYDAMMKLLPSIRFLNPPSACGPIRIDRFSPYFNSPAEFGLLNVRPIAPYKYLYPFDAGCLQRIAYYFDHDYAPGVDPRGSAEEVINYVREWQQNPEAGMLCYTYREDGALVLLDSRSGRTMPELALTGLEKAAYEYCNDLRSAGAVAHHLREVFPDVQFADRQVIDFLDSLVSNRLMVSDGSHYLSLAIAAYPAHKTDDEALIQAGVAGYAVRQADARPSPQLNSFDV